MKRAWKIFGIIALVMAGLGILSLAVGYLTGASPDRMIEVVFGGREMLDLILQTLKDELAKLF